MFLADGPVLLAEALSAGVAIDALYVEEGHERDASVRDAAAAGVVARRVAEGSLAKVLDLRSSQGMVAVVRSQQVGLDAVLAAAMATRRPLLVLAAVQDPGNAGTLVRVAEATGCVGVVLGTGSVDLHNPKTVRATAGAVFRVPVAEQIEVPTVLAACDEAGVRTVATVGRGSTSLDDVDLTGAVAVLVGAEAHGLAPEVVAACTLALSVPMEGAVESLNAAIAGSVVLFDAARQRRAARSTAIGSGEGLTMGHNGDPPAESARRAEEGNAQR